MAVWQENLKRLLEQKEVLILHGNVRDTDYIKRDGTLIQDGLSELLVELGKELHFREIRFWGVVYDHEGKAHTPLWTIERVVPLIPEAQPSIEKAKDDFPESQVLGRWLSRYVKDVNTSRILVINYIDMLTPFYEIGSYPADEKGVLLGLISKIIENITPNNRLVMIALQDSMIPMEYYTHSPKVSVMEIPLPDKEERHKYFLKYLSTKLEGENVEFLANITDGLYLRDLKNIKNAVIQELRRVSTGDMSQARLRKLVNRYRIGSEEDPWAKLPLSGPPKGLLDAASSWFTKRVVGQDHAVEAVIKAIKKARAGVVGLAAGQETKPRAVFFFAGPTGVGKTFLAKKLAEYLFDSEEAFIRFDMSEFKEEHTVSKLIGSPPGYVGYEKGGMLTNAVKTRPFSVILFDEIEKAHPKIMDIFLQILDDGRLTDSRGQTVFFTETVIIFTSNIGTRTTASNGKPIDEKSRLDEILQEKDPEKRALRVRKHFIDSVRNFFVHEISRPELLNRIGTNIIAFNYIDRENVMRKIIQNRLKEMCFSFKDKFSNKGYRLKFDGRVVDYFLKKYYLHIAQFGGRGLVNALDDEIGPVLSEQMLYAEQLNITGIEFYLYIDGQDCLRCRRNN